MLLNKKKTRLLVEYNQKYFDLLSRKVHQDTYWPLQNIKLEFLNMGIIFK